GGGGIERVFLGWERPVLHAVADRLVEGAPGPGPVDLRSEWVVVPGGRAGRRLLELLLDRAEAAGRPLRPPQVVPVGALPERLLPDPEPAPPEIVERLAWMRALDAVPGRRLARVFPELEGRADPLLRFGVAETLRGLHREVGGSGHDFADVATLCRGSFLYNDEERWVLLAEVQARYRRILEAHGLRDREALRLEALARGEVRTEGALRIVASPDLPRIVRAFLALAASRIPVEALVAAPPDLASAFDGFGCVDPEVWRTLHAE